MKSHWVDHKGQRILIADYSNFGTNTPALEQEIAELCQELGKYPPASVLVVSKVFGTAVTRNNIQALMGMLRFSKTYIRRRAVVGLNPVNTQLVGMFNKIAGPARFYIFDKLENALDWLVRENG